MQIEALGYVRQSILGELAGRGALEDFLSLQTRLAEAEARAANLRERYKVAEMLEGDATQLEIDRANLKLRLQRDHRERAENLEYVIVTIADIIRRLYDNREGRFVVDATDNGPEFKINIEGDRGGGIAQMEIFCFDLALFKVTNDRFGRSAFLIHDSHLFDGVDERQIAGALTLGREASEQLSNQYIVTMNSDVFGRLPLFQSVSLIDYVLPTRLSDDGDAGGLFGFRFE